ncbi:hypothetical protein [Cytophaga aurantiaca]|uniref:hypothetical protein n=1 Tax=Cytophaga aurantiaca TaxID=29530 RepID=UPI00037AD500|nr:hypothetical protein [Cytophaga aurantiaca]
MKLIAFLFSLPLILFTHSIQAQDIELKWGAPVKNVRGEYPSDVLGKDETGFYIFKSGSHVTLEKFDNNMNFVWRRELEIFLTKRIEVVFEDIILTKNKIIVFTSHYDSKTDTKKLFASYISKDGVIEPKLYEVNSFDNLSSKKSVVYDVTHSENSNSILIFSNFREKNTEKEKFHYKVIDENLLQKNQSFIELPYSGLNTSILDYLIDNAGNIHLVYRVNLKKEEENNRSNDDKIDFNYYIMSFYPATKEYKEYDLRVGDHLISGISLVIDKDSRYMYIPGFYSEKRLNALKGTFISKIDLINKKVIYAKQKDFDPVFLAAVYAKASDDDDEKKKDIEQAKKDAADKKKTKPKEQLYNYDILDLFVNENEEVVVVSEQYYVHVVTTSTTSSTGVTTYHTTYYYYYNNVMVTKFGADGERVWSSNIPKYQVTTNDGGFYSSVGIFFHNDVVYIFYNDNPANGTVMSQKQLRTKNPQRSQLALISVDGSGNLKKRVLMPAPAKGKGIATRPKFTVQVNDSQVLLLGYLSGQYKIGKLELSTQK